MTARTWQLFVAEVPSVAFLNIIFAVFQLVMVAYSLGQSAAVMVVNASLESAAERDGYSNGIIFTAPFFSKDGSHTNGFSCAAFLIVGSLLHLLIGLFLFGGRSTQKRAAALCIVWYTFTVLFIIGHITFTTLKILSTPPNLMPIKWNDSEIMTEIAFSVLVVLEGLQIWIVYEFAREIPDTELSYWTDPESTGQISVSPPFPRDSVSSTTQKFNALPRYSEVVGQKLDTFKNIEVK